MRLGALGVRWAAVLVLIALLLLIKTYKPEWLGLDIQSTDNRYEAIDGDSFHAGQTEIRLHGIDAPEYRQTCLDTAGVPQPCGRLARDKLSQLIRTHSVHCDITDRDRYGRDVAICRDGELNINREMVRLGWAMAYRKRGLDYVGAEDEARDAKRGIWAWQFENPEQYRARNRSKQGLVAEDE